MAGDIYEADKKVQSIDDKITLSTQFSKSTRSRNWFNKLTLDNILEVVNFIINFEGRIREITLENK